MSYRERSRSPPRYENGNHNAGGNDNGGSDEEVKLYIGNLDYSTDENRLREVFSEYGSVTDVFLPLDRDTKRPRGFGFVTFSSRSSADEAMRKMDQSEVDGRTIRVNESKPRGDRGGFNGGGGDRGSFGGGGGFNAEGKEEVKLYIGNLSFDTYEDSLRGAFEQHGTVTDCFIPTDRDTGKPRGFAFVTMPAAEAESACTKVNGLELDGRTLRVNEAQAKNDRGRGGGGGRGGGYGGGYGGRGGGGYGGGYGGGGGGGGYRGGYDR